MISQTRSMIRYLTIGSKPYRLSPLLFFIALCLSLFPQFSRAQVFGGNPPSLKWRQINTDTIRVIFPKGLESEAERIANTVLYLNRNTRASIGNRELKLNLVLQNQPVSSNGYVALGPFRSEFQTTPPQQSLDLGALDWLHLLPVHEYRHALQNMNFRVGLGKTFYDLFGQDGQALITNALVPDWFWEGDAVFMETSLSTQGRGRLPSFFDNFRGIYFEGKHYSYAKIRNGSLKDMIPDHYPLGYILTSYGREKYGRDFWRKTLNETLLNRRFILANNKEQPHPFHLFKYGFYTLSAALNYSTGHRLPGFYREALGYYEQQWREEKENMVQTPAAPLIPDTARKVVSYDYPYYLPDGSLLCVRFSYSSTPEIIRIDSSGRESTVVKMGMTADDYFSYAGGKITWAESRFDPRWGWKDYSVIRLYDLRRKRTVTLTRRSRYFSPGISPDGKQIAVSGSTTGLLYRLVLLDASTGKVVKALPNPDTLFYAFPKFTEDNRSVIAAVKNRHDEMALIEQDIQSGTIIYLTPFLHKSIGPPTVSDNYIFFPAAFGHVVNLYALQPESRQVFRVTRRLSGDYSVAANTGNGKIAFSEFSVEGNKLLKAPFIPSELEPANWQELGKVDDPYVPGALKQEGGNILDKIPSRNFTVTKYSKASGLINIHSWVLLPNYPEVGLYLESENILNTLQSSLGAGYNFNEGSPFVSLSALYGGWFPIAGVSATERFNRNGYTANNKRIFWNELNFSGGFTVPLNLSSNLYERHLTAGISGNVDQLWFLPGQKLREGRLGMNFLSASLRFSNMHISARQRIYPKFGQSFRISYNHSLNDIFATQLSTAANFFFPGLFRNHSFYLNAGYARRDTQRRYTYTDEFVYARGYGSLPYQEIYRIGANYQLPIAYPDLGATWVYLLRVRLNLFFDYSRAIPQPGNAGINDRYRSTGATLYFDTQWFKYLSIPIGVRYSYLLDRDYQDPGRVSRVEVSVPLQFF